MNTRGPCSVVQNHVHIAGGKLAAFCMQHTELKAYFSAMLCWGQLIHSELRSGRTGQTSLKLQQCRALHFCYSDLPWSCNCQLLKEFLHFLQRSRRQWASYAS